MSAAAPNKSQAETATDTQSGSHTHFDFENKLFKVEGCFFSIAEADSGVIFNIPMGEMTASLKLSSICREFNIAKGSKDYELLDLVKRGIPFVRQIRPNDVVPSEVLDGSASWHIDARHSEIALNRLSQRLVNWLTGDESNTIDRTAVMAIVNDEEMRTKVNEALEKAATIIKRKKEEVIARFEDLAKEMAYIEALRDYYTGVYRLFSLLRKYQEIYRDDTNFIQEIERMRQLMKRPVDEIKQTFDRIDIETLEVLPLLKTYEQKVSFIRAVRDDLHLHTAVWQDLKEIWEGVPLERCDESKIALLSTYKFLAKNFTVTYSW